MTMASKYNAILSMKMAQLNLKLLEVSAVNDIGNMNATQLRTLLLGEDHSLSKHNDRFADYFERFISRKVKTLTREIYQQTLNKVAKFCDVTKLRFSDITYSWLCDFDLFMQKGGNAVNTRSIHLRNVRAIYNEAINENCANQNDYPFRRFHIKTEQTQKRSLTLEELRTLRDFEVEPHIKKYVDVFFLSFYLAGINMVDLLELPPLEGNRIAYRRSKTGVLCECEVPEEALEIIERYKGVDHLVCFGEKYEKRRSFIHNMNENLQKVGYYVVSFMTAKNGARHLKKQYFPLFPKITSYWARHSWATLAAELDIPDAVIDAALGHKSPYPMTDVYVRRNAKKVDAAIREVIDALNGDIHVAY